MLENILLKNASLESAPLEYALLENVLLELRGTQQAAEELYLSSDE